MPRKTIEQQSGNPDGRFVRHLHTLNHHRRFERKVFGWGWDPHRYHHIDPSIGRAVVRNPRMRPLLHKGRKP